ESMSHDRTLSEPARHISFTVNLTRPQFHRVHAGGRAEPVAEQALLQHGPRLGHPAATGPLLARLGRLHRLARRAQAPLARLALGLALRLSRALLVRLGALLFRNGLLLIGGRRLLHGAGVARRVAGVAAAAHVGATWVVVV